MHNIFPNNALPLILSTYGWREDNGVHEMSETDVSGVLFKCQFDPYIRSLVRNLYFGGGIIYRRNEGVYFCQPAPLSV